MQRCLWLLVAAASLFAQEFKVGGKVADFSFNDPIGRPVKFSSVRGDVTVVMFISVLCPISNDYNERIVALYNDYSAKGVKFVFLNANVNESPTQVMDHAKQAGFPFPVHRDAGNVVADRFGAQVTPESYVIDKANTMLYHGAIDDARNPARVTVKGLRAALDAALAGTPVQATETRAFGCTIKRVRKTT
ncbi:MAG: redoxin domain-containing protein [Bryobacteraceae bacterium]|nr:redoxin domain-containing protein [Bryobacteraceae bacterium]